DGNGSAYITGEIFDATLNPTSGAFQTILASNDSAFVTKLDANGSNVVYSTYLGGTGAAYADGVAVDSQGSAYITGAAGTGFPTTVGAYQATTHGGQACFVTTVTPSG